MHILVYFVPNFTRYSIYLRQKLSIIQQFGCFTW